MNLNPVETLTSTLNTTYKISIPDGRIFIGTFICIDPQGNIILDRTTEYVKQKIEEEGEEGKKGREIGMVLIPKKYWMSVEREVSE